jgi:hypothetical protein
MARLSERVTNNNISDYMLTGSIVDTSLRVDVTPNVPVNNVNCTIKLNNTGETKMGIRKVSLTLIDNDNNLKGAEKIVFEQSLVTEHDNDKTIQQVLITGDVSTALDAHNKKRESTVDKAVLRSTGTKVFLEPVEIFELQWQVVQIG